MNNYLYPNSTVMKSEEEMLLEELEKRRSLLQGSQSEPLRALAGSFANPPKAPPLPPPAKDAVRLNEQNTVTKTVENTLAPVSKEHRQDLQTELNLARGESLSPDQIGQLYSMRTQKEGLDDLKAKIEAVLGQETKQDWRIPIATAAQFFGSPSGDNSALMDGMKLMELSTSRQEKEKQDLLEKLYALKQKQEQGIAGTDMAYLRALIPQAISGSTTTTTETKVKDQQKRTEGAQQALNLRRLQTSLQSDPDYKSGLKALEDMRIFQTETTTPNWLTDATARAALTSAAKLYPVSDRDVQFFSGSQDLLTRAQRGANKIISGELYTEEDRKDVDAYISYRRNVESNRVSALEKHYADNYGPTYGFSAADALKKLRPEGGRENMGVIGKAIQPSSPSQAPKAVPAGKVRVRMKGSNQVGLIPADKLDAALKSGKYEEVK